MGQHFVDHHPILNAGPGRSWRTKVFGAGPPIRSGHWICRGIHQFNGATLAGGPCGPVAVDPVFELSQDRPTEAIQDKGLAAIVQSSGIGAGHQSRHRPVPRRKHCGVAANDDPSLGLQNKWSRKREGNAR